MAFKLTKSELVTRDIHLEKLRELASKIEDEVNAANEKLSEVLRPVKDAITAYNAYLDETVSGFTTDLASRLTDEMGDKSEAWQEGEKGSAVADFIQEWESVDLAAVEELDEEAFEVSVDAPEHADTIEGLPVEPE